MVKKTYADMTEGEIAAYRRGWMSALGTTALPIWLAGSSVMGAVGFIAGLVVGRG